MIAACNRKDIDAVLACFAEDVHYHNIPMDPVSGHAGVRAMLEPFFKIASEVDWVVHKSVSNGLDTVMNERTDRFLMPDGWVDLPVMGVFEVNGGKITAWRDYFDMAPVVPLLNQL
ncbi:hypothetical protein MB02_12915 [Croceicoccus estronivorus]|nr:hypothetical protein MB02_12915 [Croceicoccus estronivorus]